MSIGNRKSLSLVLGLSVFVLLNISEAQTARRAAASTPATPHVVDQTIQPLVMVGPHANISIPGQNIVNITNPGNVALELRKITANPPNVASFRRVFAIFDLTNVSAANLSSATLNVQGLETNNLSIITPFVEIGAVPWGCTTPAPSSIPDFSNQPPGACGGFMIPVTQSYIPVPVGTQTVISNQFISAVGGCLLVTLSIEGDYRLPEWLNGPDIYHKFVPNTVEILARY